MHSPEDEVVRLIHADLGSRFAEVFGVQVLHDLHGPPWSWHLHVEKLWRPAPEEHGPPTNAVSEAGKSTGHIGTPWQPPDLRARNTRIRRSRRRCRHSDVWQVLRMLGEYEWAGFENQDAVIVEFVAVEEVLGQSPAEGTAADNHDVKRPGTRLTGGAAHGLIEAV